VLQRDYPDQVCSIARSLEVIGEPGLIVLMKWGDRHYPTPGGPPRLTLHAGCGGNIGPDLHCDRCGQHAERGEIELPPGPGAPRADHARR
jgi:hypothetical protein